MQRDALCQKGAAIGPDRIDFVGLPGGVFPRKGQVRLILREFQALAGARGGLDVVGTELKASFFLRGATDASTFDLAEIIGDAPEIREDMVRVGGMSKSADVRYRAMFVHWEIPMLIEYNKNGKYSLEQLMNCVNVGGFACGIGEWRPEKDGQFGMYRLKVS